MNRDVVHEVTVVADEYGYERWECSCGIVGAVWWNPAFVGQARRDGGRHAWTWNS